MSLSEHVYCVVFTFKMTEQVDQQVCIKFCINLDHSSAETIWMIQKAATMGNWWWAASSHSTHARHLVQSFLRKHQLSQVTQPRYSPDLVPRNFWLFPKLKLPLKRKRFQTVNEIQENKMGQLMAIGRTVWGPKVPTLKGTRHHCPMYNVSYILYLLQ